MSVDQTTDAPVIEAPPRRTMSLQLKVGLVITGSIVLLGLLAPWISPHPWDTISMRTRFVPPNATYWFGTDEYGRDVLSRLLMGTRLSLTMGVSATLVSLAVGVPMGLAAGYFRGWIDEALMRLADVLMAVPPIMLGLLVLAVTPPALWKTALAVGFVYIPPIARLARSVTLTLANEEFIQAAKARAESNSYILFREILPNAWPPLIVEASLRVVFAETSKVETTQAEHGHLFLGPTEQASRQCLPERIASRLICTERLAVTRG